MLLATILLLGAIPQSGQVARAVANAPAEAVAEATCLGLRQHFVGFDRLAESLLGIGRVGDVRVKLPGKAAESPLDLGVFG